MDKKQFGELLNEACKEYLPAAHTYFLMVAKNKGTSEERLKDPKIMETTEECK